MSAMLLE